MVLSTGDLTPSEKATLEWSSTGLMETQGKISPLGAETVGGTDEKHNKVDYLLETSAMGIHRQRREKGRVGVMLDMGGGSGMPG